MKPQPKSQHQNISRARNAIASTAWLYLPAYLALLIALGGACRALAHFITNPNVAGYLWVTLFLNILVSLGLQCGSPKILHWCARARWLLFALLPVVGVLFNSSVLAPLDAEAEINATVALVVGWSAIVCILLVGVRYGQRRVPLAAPLVPGLSLFGLLNSLSVDTIIQICFLVFVAASLYLIVYERMLHRLMTQKRALESGGEGESRPARGRSGGAPNSSRTSLPRRFSRAGVARAAAGYLAACSVWFAAFLAGAAIFYYPVEAILPRVLSTPLGAVRGASSALLDWRGSSPVMELRGGNYPLSDREIMRVELAPPESGMGSIPALWRGRVYEQYSDSRWVESELPAPIKIKGKVKELIPVRAKLLAQIKALSAQGMETGFEESLLSFDRRLVRRHQITAFVEPLRYNSTAIYFPGELEALQSSSYEIQASPTGVYRTTSSFLGSRPYVFHAQVNEERLSGLSRAPGLSPARLKAWKSNSNSARSLALEDDLKKQLAPIVRQIEGSAGSGQGGFKATLAKANAIRDYLARTCEYSLSAPLVPATEDAVIFFMTNSKRGACDMFASSMVVLLRAMDVPARLATGFIEPEEITNGQTTTGGTTLALNPNEQGAYDGALSTNAPAISFTIREREAHAWVEYYVPGAGWLTYDPTAGTRTTQLPLDAQIATIFHFPSFSFAPGVLWLPMCGLLLIAAGISWSAFESKNKRAIGIQTPVDFERARIAEAYKEALKLLRRRVPRGLHQTPLEYEAVVNRASIPDPAKQEFAALTYLLMAANYKRDLPPTVARDLQLCLMRLRRALRALK